MTIDKDISTKGASPVRLTFISNRDGSKKDPQKGTDKFEVMINPDTITRVLGLTKTNNASGRSKDKGDAFSILPEKISFSFYLDGTNIVPEQKGRQVKQMIADFLKVVYKKRDADTQPVQAVAINYGDYKDYIVRLDSLTIDYTLFNTDGDVLRAKVTCGFSTINEDAPKKPKPPRKGKGSFHETKCVCVPQECRDNNQNSIKEPNMTPIDANYSHQGGYSAKV